MTWIVAADEPVARRLLPPAQELVERDVQPAGQGEQCVQREAAAPTLRL